MTKDELITRIKKLLALSDSSNPNEAAIALSRAQKLMQQYKIEMQDLEESVISERGIEISRGMKNIKNLSLVGSILTKVMGVEFIYQTSRSGSVQKVSMIGPKESLESCEYIFVILIRSVMTAKKNYTEKICLHILDYILNEPELREALSDNPLVRTRLDELEQQRDLYDGAYSDVVRNMKFLCFDPTFDYVFKKLKRELPDSFMFGYFQAVYARVAEFVQDDELKDAIEKFKQGNYKDLKIKSTKKRSIHSSAYSEGCEQGEKVNLMNAVHDQGVGRKLLK